jgi:hypothetical protein
VSEGLQNELKGDTISQGLIICRGDEILEYWQIETLTGIPCKKSL